MEVLVFRELQAETYRVEQTLQQGLILPLAFPDVAIDIQRLIDQSPE
jgi:hypothetical protein